MGKKHIHGWVILDKPQGMTSTQASSKVKRLFNAKKAGHAGTLDPMATGILPIALGEATKLMVDAVDGGKAYQFDVTFGESTDTDDAEGNVTDAVNKLPKKDEILATIPQFIGTIPQVPPKYSAAHVDGKRAYALAREGHDFELAPRLVTIHRLELVKVINRQVARFEIECGKGTYIRSLARDMAKKMGSLGHVSHLRRVKSGLFDESDTILLENLEEIVHNSAASGEVPEPLLSVDAVLDDIPVLQLSPSDVKEIRNGQATKCDDLTVNHDRAAAYDEAHRLIALGQQAHGWFKPKRVFVYPKNEEGE